jgi:hypothetical protein
MRNVMNKDDNNGYYANYDLHAGTHNTWRRTKNWPKVGKGDLAVWAVVPATFLFSLLFGNMVTEYLWNVFYFISFLFVVCKMRNQNVNQLVRYLLQRFRVKHKRNTPLWLERSLFAIVLTASVGIFGVGMNSQAYAKFEIVIPPREAAVDTFVSSGKIYLQGGFGKDVKLNDLMLLILPEPLSAEFANSELKDLKVSWYSDGKIYLNEILANISRRYGVMFVWRNAAGILEVQWDKGTCKRVIEESRNEQLNYSNQLGTRPAEPLRVIEKTINKEQQMEIIC